MTQVTFGPAMQAEVAAARGIFSFFARPISRCQPSPSIAGIDSFGMIISDDGSSYKPYLVYCYFPSGSQYYYDANELAIATKIAPGTSQPVQPDALGAARSAFNVGDPVHFAIDDSAAYWVGCPGTRLSFSPGYGPSQGLYINSIAGAFFTTQEYPSLWAPLSALHPTSGACDAASVCETCADRPTCKWCDVEQRCATLGGAGTCSAAVYGSASCPGRRPLPPTPAPVVSITSAKTCAACMSTHDVWCSNSKQCHELYSFQSPFPCLIPDAVFSVADCKDAVVDPCASISACASCAEKAECKWCDGEKTCKVLGSGQCTNSVFSKSTCAYLPPPPKEPSAIGGSWPLPKTSSDELFISFEFTPSSLHDHSAVGIAIDGVPFAITMLQQEGQRRCYLPKSGKIVPYADCNFDFPSHYTINIAPTSVNLIDDDGHYPITDLPLSSTGKYFTMYSRGGSITQLDIQTEEERFVDRHVKSGAVYAAGGGGACKKGYAPCGRSGECFDVRDSSNFCMCYRDGYIGVSGSRIPGPACLSHQGAGVHVESPANGEHGHAVFGEL